MFNKEEAVGKLQEYLSEFRKQPQKPELSFKPMMSDFEFAWMLNIEFIKRMKEYQQNKNDYDNPGQ